MHVVRERWRDGHKLADALHISLLPVSRLMAYWQQNERNGMVSAGPSEREHWRFMSAQGQHREAILGNIHWTPRSLNVPSNRTVLLY